MIGAGEPGEGDEGKTRLDGSSQIRLFIWQAGLRMIHDYPLGVGYGLFPFYLGQYSNIARFRAAHNSYILIATETGLLGLVMFLIFLGLLLWESWIVFRRSEDRFMKGLGLAAFGSTLSMMISVTFYSFFFVIQVNGQQWLLLGVLSQIRRLTAAPAEPAAPAASPAGATEVPLYRLVT